MAAPPKPEYCAGLREPLRVHPKSDLGYRTTRERVSVRMKLPRIMAVASATTAAAAAFLVASRWGIMGTAAGAIVMAAVYTVVSHFSTESLDRTGRWLRRRLRPGAGTPDGTVSERTPSSAGSGPGEADGAVGSPKGGRGFAWPVAIVALLSLGAGLYSVSIAGRIAEPIFLETVVERTIIVTEERAGMETQTETTVASTQADGGDPAAPTEANDAATAPAGGGEPTALPDGGSPTASTDQGGSVAPSAPPATTTTTQPGGNAPTAEVNTEAPSSTGDGVLSAEGAR